MEHFYKNIDGWFTYPNLYKGIINWLPNNSHFIEIGSWKGKSTAFAGVEIINSNKKIKFTCIDTWNGSVEHIGEKILEDDNLYKEFIKNIEPIKNSINIVRNNSVDASKSFDDRSIDCVFIDASHEYEDVLDDIKHWYFKLKAGGILCGHDYGSFEGVTKAVHNTFSNFTFDIHERVWAVKK